MPSMSPAPSKLAPPKLVDGRGADCGLLDHLGQAVPVAAIEGDHLLEGVQLG